MNQNNQLIPFIKNNHIAFTAVEDEVISLPKIVAIAVQSAGKSSILETLVGDSFFPKSPGSVTRQLIILQLVHVDDPKGQEYAEFTHMPEALCKDFNDIRKEIEQETIRKTGPIEGICEDPIVLEIYFPKVVANLMLVDLPGLTKVPVGDQLVDIDREVKHVSMKYIRQPSTIILAMLAANINMSINGCLQMALQIGTKGVRTTAAVTKLDITDSGTNASDMLIGKVFPVRLGIIGVINRSHLDNMPERAIEECQKDEKRFFQAKYPTICHLHGSQYLPNSLSKILMKHIDKTVPDLRQAVTTKRISIQEELGLIDGVNNQIIIREVWQYAEAYKDALARGLRNLNSKETKGEIIIGYIFKKGFASILDSLDPMASLTPFQIYTELLISQGSRCVTLFIPELCFENLIRRQLSQLQEPCFYLVRLIHDELLSIVRSCANSAEVGRFPKLFDSIFVIVEDLLNERLHATKCLVKDLLDAEITCIDGRRVAVETEFDVNNASDTEGGFKKLLGFLNSRTTKINHQSDGPPKASYAKIQSKRVEILEKLIINYFNETRNTLKASIPKAIMLKMVNDLHHSIYRNLLKRLYKTKSIESLLGEPGKIQHRAHLHSSLRTLRTAEKMLRKMCE